MKFISVHEKDETDYIHKRLGFLQNAKDVCITHSINGEYEIDFKLPQGDPKWGLIEVERQVAYDGKAFRIKMIEGTTILGETLLHDSCRTHIQHMDDMINMPANEIVEKIFDTTPYVTVLSKEELAAIGLEAVTEKFDFFEVSKKTPMGCLNMLMERLKKYRIHSEIYIDNNKIGLVRRLGRDRGVVIDQRFNGIQIKPTFDTHALITKLYPYGKDDLPLAEAAYKVKADGTVEVIPLTDEDKKQGKRGYVLSPNYDTLGEHEGFCNFDGVDEPEDLLSAALLQFGAKNPERIDIPKYSLDIRMVELRKEVRVGDLVTVNDVDNGIKTKQRVITTKTYPYEPHRNSIVVGVPPITSKEAFSGMFTATQYQRLRENENKVNKTNSIEFMKKNTDVTVENNRKFQKIAQYETGAMFVSPNGKYAVAIIDGKIKIGVKDSSKADGWNWIGVFGHGEGDAATQTFLYTNLITIMSESGELKIEDNLIQMFDSNGTLRFNAGYSESLNKYVFELYNTDGRRTAYMDDNGNLTICGIFKTGEDGENRVVIDGNGLTSYNSNNKKDGLSITTDFPGASLILYSDGDKAFEVRNEGIDSITFRANNSEVMSLSSVRSALGGVWYYNGKEIATQADIRALQEQINELKR